MCSKYEMFFLERPYADISQLVPLSPNVRDLVPNINRFNAFAFGVYVLNGGIPFIPFCEKDSKEYVMKWFHRANKKESHAWDRVDVFSYVQIFKDCWDPEPLNRPSFVEVLNRLNSLGL